MCADLFLNNAFCSLVIFILDTSDPIYPQNTKSILIWLSENKLLCNLYNFRSYVNIAPPNSSASKILQHFVALGGRAISFARHRKIWILKV